MSILAKPYTFSPNTTISSSQVNSDFDTLYNDYNGGISAANLATGAVTTAKIADANVTTAKIADANVTNPKLVNSGVFGSSWAWQDWTPSYANITVGNGTVIAKYTQIGKAIHFRYSLVCGSTTTLASGATITAPVTANSDYGTTNVRTSVGHLNGLDVGTAAYWGFVEFSASTTILTLKWNDGTAPASNVWPWTEASGDTFTIHGTYEAA